MSGKGILLVFFACVALTEVSTEHYRETTQDSALNSDEYDFEGLAVRGVVNGFLRLARETRANDLPSPLDLVFAVDGSNDVSPQNFHLQKLLVSGLARQFSLSPSGTRVAAVSYGTHPTLEFDFDTNVNRECTLRSIHRIRSNKGQSHPARALHFIKNEVFREKTEARTRRALFIIITGTPTNRGASLISAARELKRRGVEVFILVVHRYMDMIGVGGVASRPHRDHVFHVKNFHPIRELAEAVRFKGFVRKCSGPRVVYDECHRRCVCRDGELEDCHRIRKEFTSMNLSERRRYIRALVIVSSTQPHKTQYDKLTRLHPRFFYKVHVLKYFFPWHRWYILKFENLLRKIDCRITVPYWDWAQAISQNRLWHGHHIRDFWYPGPHGFGGDGHPPGNCVESGPFRAGQWELSPWLRRTCLKRFFKSMEVKHYDNEYVRRFRLLHLHEFKRFEMNIRHKMHNGFHNAVGGTMALDCSASAPEFWTHHGFLDKLWSDWQDRGPAFKFQHYRKVHTRLPGSAYFGWEFMDLQRQPLCVKALYKGSSRSPDEEEDDDWLERSDG